MYYVIALALLAVGIVSALRVRRANARRSEDEPARWSADRVAAFLALGGGLSMLSWRVSPGGFVAGAVIAGVNILVFLRRKPQTSGEMLACYAIAFLPAMAIVLLIDNFVVTLYPESR